jgi:arylsulfatase A-like enzyme
MSDWKVADWGVQRLREEYDRPFFIGLGFSKPHLPWFVPRKYFERHPLGDIVLPRIHEHDLEDVPPAGRRFALDGVGFAAVPGGDHASVTQHRQWAHGVQGYLAACSFVDSQVGRVLDALEASPHGRSTIVIVWGDHGWHLGQKLHWRKHALWEEANRCAVIISAPDIARAGALCERPVSLLDLYPTLIELCRLPGRNELEGSSLVPLLKDPKAVWNRPVVTTYGRHNHSIRTQRWRYIRYEDGTEELYDHEHDDLEWTNLASDPHFRDVKQELARFLPKVNAPPPGSGQTPGDE